VDHAKINRSIGVDMVADGGRGGRSSVMFAQTSRGCGRGDDTNSCYSEIFSYVNNNNSEKFVLGIENETKENIKCFGCQFYVHYHGDYSTVRRTGINLVHIEPIFT